VVSGVRGKLERGDAWRDGGSCSVDRGTCSGDRNALRVAWSYRYRETGKLGEIWGDVAELGRSANLVRGPAMAPPEGPGG